MSNHKSQEVKFGTLQNIKNYGIHGDGTTVKEAVDDFNASYIDMKALQEKKDKEFVETEFDFKYDIASFLEHYSKIISLAGLERLTGVNPGQLSHYLTRHRKPSKKTAEKIQTKLHEFGKRINSFGICLINTLKNSECFASRSARSFFI